MVMDLIIGLEYTITLDKEYDYYEMIPMLEMKFKRRFSLYERSLTIISVRQTKDRFMNSTHYKGDSFYDYDTKSYSDNDDLPIIISDDEQQLINDVKNYISDKIVKTSWYLSMAIV
jgi:hypothetical protein